MCISEPEEMDRERRLSAAERNTLASTSVSQTTAASSHYFDSKRNPDGVNPDVENIDFHLSPTTRQLTRSYRPSPSTSVDIPLRVQLQRRNDQSFDFDLLDEIDQDENQPPPSGQRPFGAANTPPLPSRDLKGKGLAEPFTPFFVDRHRKSLSKIDDASSDDYGMMGMDDNDFADAEFLENLDRVEMEALLGSGGPNRSGGVGLPGSSGSGSGLGLSYVLVDGDKQTSLSASAPIVSSTSSSIKQLNIIEIGSSDEDDEMLGTDDKENEPVTTRHVKRRTEDLDEEVRERGRGLFASQGWDPLHSEGSGRRSGGLRSQNQSQSQRQGLKPRVLAMDVIDLSNSDDD